MGKTTQGNYPLIDNDQTASKIKNKLEIFKDEYQKVVNNHTKNADRYWKGKLL